MNNPKPSLIELFQKTEQIITKIPADFGGGSPLSKSFLMAYIALEYNLKNFVEIGIYRGRSFFPMAYVSKLLGGKAYGIDPYDYEIAKEYDQNETLVKDINEFLESLDFLKIYESVMNLRQVLDLVDNCEILKEKSSCAIEYFREYNISIDILHIDGNHDTKYVMEDVNLYFPLVRDGGFIVLDDIDWDSVRPAYDLLREKSALVFENNLFAIYYVGDSVKNLSILERRIFDFLPSIISQRIENDQAIHALTAQVAETKQQLAEIENSRAWHYVKIFRKVRSWFRGK